LHLLHSREDWSVIDRMTAIQKDSHWKPVDLKSEQHCFFYYAFGYSCLTFVFTTHHFRKGTRRVGKPLDKDNSLENILFEGYRMCVILIFTFFHYINFGTLSSAVTFRSFHTKKGVGFINILRRRATVFHWWAKLFEPSFFIKRTFFLWLSSQVGKINLALCQ